MEPEKNTDINAKCYFCKREVSLDTAWEEGWEPMVFDKERFLGEACSECVAAFCHMAADGEIEI